MTFEEFFIKKKIDLVKLKAGDAALFAEFKAHYELMGEKSFDYTKKYWFNDLRRKYHTPDEPKVEKVKTESQLAGQTITQSITDNLIGEVAVRPAYRPKFKTDVSQLIIPAESADKDSASSNNEVEPPAGTSQNLTADQPAGKPAYKPRFQMKKPPAAE